ncbi:MAG: RNA methyltransferase [Candidatus Cellulosilyticum pullistercoris]|uniref:RNA methyltransferase n=1 Tax=Candidatus Cellulosilyticum pullistercoris TaxID=2838521 RepID=A0A9E2NP38_9FIRM|nr:RNA methyltransferase [Candidatus Cellulosilyticum pullistercoris]
MDKKNITSMQNPIIKLVKELQKKKAARKKNQLFIVEGIRAVQEIPNKQMIEYLIVSNKLDEAIYHTLSARKVLVLPEDLFCEISDTQTPQGMMAIVKIPDISLEEICLSDGPYLILENLQDPGNLGTIIRTAHAFNFKGIFITKGSVDLYSPKVVRSTMSSLFYMPIITDETIETYITYLKAKGITLYTTALTERAKPIQETIFEKKMALIIGNEGNGVSPYCLEETDHTVIIPMPGGAESLNASIAAAVCMYEITR